jgi:hypothetical protein
MIKKSMAVRVGADTTEMERGLEAAEARIKKFNEQCSKIGRGMTIAGTAIIAALTLVTKKASDAQETYAKFGTVFKDSSEEAERAVSELTKRYGLSTLASKDMLSATGDLLTGLGMESKVALALSRQTQKLSVDLASFTNYKGGAKGASEALTKAMLGEREMIKSLGIVITEEMVKEHLLREGKDKLTGQALLQAKAEATLALAMSQSKNAIGDYERTSDSLANVTRRLFARLQDLWVLIGSKLIPVATKIATKVIDVVEKVKAWTEAHPKLAETIVKVAAAVGVLLAVLGPLAMALPSLVSGFTMLGGAFSVLLGPAGLAALAIAAIAVSVKAMADNLKNARQEMSNFADEAAIFSNAAENFSKLWIVVREEGGQTLEQFNKLFNRFGGNWDSIMKTIVRDPKFAILKALLLDIASGVKKVELQGKELSIKMPEDIRKVDEAVNRGRPMWISLAGTFAQFAETVSVKLLKLKGMAKKALDLGPAFKLPDFKMAEQEFETFEEYLKAWMERFVARMQTAWQAAMEGCRAVVSTMDNLFGQFHENQARRIENEEKQQTDAIEAWFERERARLEATIMNEEAKVAALEALDEEKARRENELAHKMDKERRKLERSRAKSQKVTALFSAGINVAEAITKALTAGPLIGQILAGIVAGLGMIQVAAIAAAPLPALAKGGRIGREGGIVGEKGIELFVPDRPGTIIPLNRGPVAGAGAFSFSPIINIYPRSLDDRTINHAAERIFVALERERRRRGF